jgi:hypothetical protein
MIAYVTVSADDIVGAKRFYSAFLPALDCGLEEASEGLSCALPVQLGQSPVLLDVYVKPTFDGHPASAGNGAMIAFEARSQMQVGDLHFPKIWFEASDFSRKRFQLCAAGALNH